METKRKSPTKITSELITKLKELVESGMKNVDICKELEIRSTTLTSCKKKYNIKYIKPTAEDYKDLYKKGYLETLLSQVLVAKSKSGELLGTPEVDNQQPS